MTSKICTKCEGEFTWKLPYDGTKEPCGDKPCTCSSKTKKTYGNTEPLKNGPANDTAVSRFETEYRTAYHALEGIAAELSPEGATAKEKHIMVCGMLHDYFTQK